MRRYALLFIMLPVIAALLAGPGYAGDTPLERATKLYRMNHYEQAVKFREYLSSVRPEQKGIAYLSLGIFYLGNARLHGGFHEASVSVHIDYFKKISSMRGKDRSRVVNLYMAEALLEDGRPKQAALYLKKTIEDSGIKAGHKAIAKAGLGLSHYLRGEKQQAEAVWSELNGSSNPEALSELAAAYGRARLNERKPAELCEKALSMLKKSGKKPSVRVIGNTIGVYARADMIDKGLDLLRDADLKAFSYEESPDRNKVIRFYDPSLLGNLSMLYAKAGIVYLTKALDSPAVRDMARYHLGEAYAFLGMVDASGRAASALVSSAQTPARLKNSAKVRQAANLYLGGGKSKATGLLEKLSRENPKDPFLLAEILLACSSLKAECLIAAESASALTEADGGRRLSRINYALGRYYLGRKDYAKAILYMEAGRDKGNKNKIESNDPLMLIDLAKAYYSTKKFSEALEIYFEMSKQFEAVRQIQVAMQGIYSMEQKSAGDVKVF